MRGYRILKNTDQLGKIRRLKVDLIDTRFTEIDQTARLLMFGASLSQAELASRQFLLQKIIVRETSGSLIGALLYSTGNRGTPVVFPLPRLWQYVLIAQGYKVATRRCSLLWLCFVGAHFCFGVLTITKIAVASLCASMKVHHGQVEKYYTYFDGLRFGVLPQHGAAGSSYDIVTWYSQWEGRAREISSLKHGVRGVPPTEVEGLQVDYIGKPFQALTNLISLLRFVSWSIKAAMITLIDLFSGRWWHALLLAESAKACAVRLTSSGKLARDYLFHYSENIFRPLWTYEAEKKKSRIILYFYSIFENIKLPEGYVSYKFEWSALNWPVLLVWDEYQTESLRGYIENKSIIKVVGPIYFRDSAVEIPKIPRKSIAVFDIDPIRKSALFDVCTFYGEYSNKNPELNLQFLKDIKLVLAESGCAMIFKRKRNYGHKPIKKYMGLIQDFSRSENVIIVDPSISPIRVIKKSKAVISMCFTTTAHYMRDQDIPSVYYDPTGWIQKDDRGAHGIPILSGIDELRAWVSSVFTEQKTI